MKAARFFRKVAASVGLLLIIAVFTRAVGNAESEADGYDVIVVAGQSNAVGRGLGDVVEKPVYLQEVNRVFQLGRFGADDGNIIPASEPLQHWGQVPGKNPDRKGFAYPLALRYAHHGLAKQRKVLLVPVARGSTTILLWDREQQGFTHAGIDDSGPTILWDDMVRRTRQALESHPGNRLVAVLWHQGEADINALANPRSGLHKFMTGGGLYRAKLEELRAELRTTFDVPGQKPFMFLIGECSETWAPMKGSAVGRKAKADIAAAMKAAAASDPTGASQLVSSAGIVGTNPGEDGLHFSATGALQLGERFYEAMMNLQAELEPSGVSSEADEQTTLVEPEVKPKQAIEDGFRVYTAGHSFHFWVAPTLSDLAEKAGIKMYENAGVSYRGASSVQKIWDMSLGEKAREALRNGEVDVLTLAPIWMPDEGIEKFARLGLEHNSELRITVQEVWLPNDTYHPVYPLEVRNYVDHNATNLVELRAHNERYRRDIEKQVQELNQQLGRKVWHVVPVGEASIALREKIIKGEASGLKVQGRLFLDGWGHPRTPPRILAAYCHFAVIYRRSPVGLPMPEELFRNNEYASEKLNRLLQELAWDAVSRDPYAGLIDRSS
jgi:hypothetical protein